MKGKADSEHRDKLADECADKHSDQYEGKDTSTHIQRSTKKEARNNITTHVGEDTDPQRYSQTNEQPQRDRTHRHAHTNRKAHPDTGPPHTQAHT